MYIVRASVKIGATEPRFFEQALKYFRQAAGIFIFNSNNVTLYLFWQTKAKSYKILLQPLKNQKWRNLVAFYFFCCKFYINSRWFRCLCSWNKHKSATACVPPWIIHVFDSVRNSKKAFLSPYFSPQYTPSFYLFWANSSRWQYISHQIYYSE